MSIIKLVKKMLFPKSQDTTNVPEEVNNQYSDLEKQLINDYYNNYAIEPNQKNEELVKTLVQAKIYILDKTKTIQNIERLVQRLEQHLPRKF